MTDMPTEVKEQDMLVLVALHGIAPRHQFHAASASHRAHRLCMDVAGEANLRAALALAAASSASLMRA